ncbi:MAG: ankyrin repeat domain-containing protein, partial [Kofleriaceae bacterium]|nr:ankyrin repeat domain-containing protein [Kofleriaceae bacterium]
MGWKTRSAEVNRKADRLERLVSSGDLKQVQKLVTGTRSPSLRAALQLAVQWDYVEIASFLIENGAKVSSHARYESNLLVSAVSGAMADLLLANGLSPTPPNSGYWTPLHHAASNSLLDVVKSMLRAGADADTKDSKGDRPVDLTSLQEIRSLLGTESRIKLATAVSNLTVREALETGDIERAEKLASEGITVLESESVWVLREAARAGRVDIICFLSRQGHCIRDERALADAVDRDRLEAAELLLEHGAGPNTKTWLGVGLYGFVKSAAMAALLNEAGIAIQSANQSGRTPLHLAAQTENGSTVVEILLAAGANKRCKDAAGCEPQHLARTDNVR